MLLENKKAVIYGAGGAIGGVVARTFAREGAEVFLAGRTLASLDSVAKDISAAGGVADTAQVDALGEQAVERHADEVAQTARAAARHMVETGSGVILVMTTTPDRRAIPLVGSFGVVLAAIEAFSHTLAAELGPRGVRVVCLRSTGSPEAPGVPARQPSRAGCWQCHSPGCCPVFWV
jgi:3-oxoacyl-[acyl-carrier protein] reductase